MEHLIYLSMVTMTTLSLCHTAPLRMTCDPPKMFKSTGIRHQQGCLTRLPSDQGPEAILVLGQRNNTRGH